MIHRKVNPLKLKGFDIDSDALYATFVGDDIQIRDSIWRRLNDQPLSTLPDSEGMGARRRFEEISKPLLAQRKAQASYYSDCAVETRRSKEGFFIYWSDRCYKGSSYDPVAWSVSSIDDIGFSRGRGVGYSTQCSYSPDAKLEDYYTEEFLPSPYVGFLVIDWDQDGNDNIAFLLKGGQFVFFEQRNCCEECIS